MFKSTKLLCLSILLIIGCHISVKSQNNILQRQLFDADWKFFQGDPPNASANNFDDKSWRSLDLPHDWSIEGAIELKNPMRAAGGYFPSGTGWYRKTFKAPAAWQGKYISIYFEGVYMNANVFINGKSLGIHPYGYTSFFYDLTPYLNINKENTIAVRVDNSQQINSRWYSGSGIYRHVWFRVTDPVHLNQWNTVITTPEITPGKATVQIKTFVKNDTKLPQSIVLSTQLTDNKSKSVGKNDMKVEIPANDGKEVTQTITVNNPSLWTPATPVMYQAQLKVIQNNKTIDLFNNAFGFRTIKFSTDKGFQLNGKTVKINGGCVHHDNGCLGAAAYDRAEARRVELLKEAGFNLIRTSHNPPSEAFLDACDRLGMMVIDESFDGWKASKNPNDYGRFFDEWWQRDLASMVMRDRNHPSIIMWSIGNEIIERKQPEALKITNMLVNEVRKMDPTRPVTSAMTTWDRDWEIFDPMFAAQDIAGYNYQIRRASSDHQRVPNRIILQTESYPRDAFDNWNLVQSNNYIIGDVVWTALDYFGESGIGRYYYPGESGGNPWDTDLYPWHGSYCGDVDLIGWRKPISHYRNLLWNDNEKLYMAVREPNPDNGKIKVTPWAVWPTWESWTWPGQEGKDLQVEVYSKYPLVRLYLNNKLVAEKPTTKEQMFKAVFTLPYAPGLLKAVGVDNNKELETSILKTATQPAKIKLIADRTKILANGEDLSFVRIEVTDQAGNKQPNADNLLTFTVKGPGVIAGVDNANLKDTNPYVGTTRKAWQGRALVVIKSTHTTGDIQLKVSSPGLADGIVTIKTAKN